MSHLVSLVLLAVALWGAVAALAPLLAAPVPRERGRETLGWIEDHRAEGEVRVNWGGGRR